MSLRARRGVRWPMVSQFIEQRFPGVSRADSRRFGPLVRHLIQLVPASLFHFVVIFFDCVQNSIDPRPVMSPTPNLDSFQPPNENGSRGTGTPTFTPTIPRAASPIT